MCGAPVGVASFEQTQVPTPAQTVSAPAYAAAPPSYAAAPPAFDAAPPATPFASAGDGGGAPVVPADATREGRSSSRILVLVATGVVVAIAIAAAFFLVVDRHKSHPTAGSSAPPAASAQTNDAASPAAAAAAATSADEMKPLVKKIESWMRSSAAGRNDIQSAVNGTYSFAMQPSGAAALVSGVVSNRQSLLAQVRATPAPTDKNARRMLALMQASLTWSLAADKSFRTWIDQSAQAQAMGAGRAPLNAAYKAGVAKSKRANTVKAALAALVDSSAATYGLRSDWTSSDF